VTPWRAEPHPGKNNPMDLGLTMFPTDTAIAPDQLAREAEDRGFESLFFPEHTHIPIGRRTPYPAGGPLPEEYSHSLDPFVALGAAAAVTSRLRLGTAVCLVAQRDPIVLAKEVASLDHLSGGRVVFGIGYGWNVDEMEDHGVVPSTRRALLREKVLAMQGLWRDEVAGFDGEHVRFEPSWSWPKPIQRPHPPILVGGAPGPTLFRHVVEFATGWMPLTGVGSRDVRSALRAAAEEAGRDPASVDVVPVWARADQATLEHYATLGVTRSVLGLPPAPADQVLPILDGYRKLMDALAD
jgi:probable F420-dependent oxidoreductase